LLVGSTSSRVVNSHNDSGASTNTCASVRMPKTTRRERT
jgi:hypothetical protein